MQKESSCSHAAKVLTVEGCGHVRESGLGSLEARRDVFCFALGDSHQAAHNNDEDCDKFRAREQILRSGCQIDAITVQIRDCDFCCAQSMVVVSKVGQQSGREEMCFFRSADGRVSRSAGQQSAFRSANRDCSTMLLYSPMEKIVINFMSKVDWGQSGNSGVTMYSLSVRQMIDSMAGFKMNTEIHEKRKASGPPKASSM